jgi:hypothetical protein
VLSNVKTYSDLSDEMLQSIVVFFCVLTRMNGNPIAE